DDSGWKDMPVPLSGQRVAGQPGYGIRWLRRSVDLPELARDRRLVISLGVIHGSYELYLDGVLAGRRGEPRGGSTLFPVPMSFSFWNGQRRHLSIAIRYYEPKMLWAFAWRPRDAGPWLVTSETAAPVGEPARFATLMRAFRLGDLIQPIVQLTLAMVV